MAGRFEAARDEMRRLAQLAAWLLAPYAKNGATVTAAELLGEAMDVKTAGSAEAAVERLRRNRGDEV